MEIATFTDYVALFGQPSDADLVRGTLAMINEAVSDRIVPEILADWQASRQAPAEIRLLVLRTTRTLALEPPPGLRSESLGGYSVGYQAIEGLNELLDVDLLAPYTGTGRVYSVRTPSAYVARPWETRWVPTPPAGWSQPRRITGYDGPYTPVYENWPESGGEHTTRRG